LENGIATIQLDGTDAVSGEGLSKDCSSTQYVTAIIAHAAQLDAAFEKFDSYMELAASPPTKKNPVKYELIKIYTDTSLKIWIEMVMAITVACAVVNDKSARAPHRYTALARERATGIALRQILPMCYDIGSNGMPAFPVAWLRMIQSYCTSTPLPHLLLKGTDTENMDALHCDPTGKRKGDR
jgi:hypothetical protein